MRIGNIMDASNTDAKVIKQTTTNYSKADIKQQVKVDIAGIGKDTNFLVDQGRSIQDVKDIAGALDVQTTQDYMTVMSNTMSGEDYTQMMKDGFDPAEMTGKESSTILDHIKAVMAETGQIVAGYNDDLDRETLIGITGSATDANSILKAMKESDIPATEENAKDIKNAADILKQIENLSESAIAYMIENHMAPTIDNIYKANFSAASSVNSSKGYYALDMSGYLGKKADVSGEELMSDIKAAVDRFGIEDIEYNEQIEGATWLVEKDINVTPDNIVAYHNLNTISFPINIEEAYKAASIAIKEGKSAKEANLLPEYEDVYSKAARIYKETNEISSDAVDIVASEGKSINLKNLSAAQKTIIIEGHNTTTQINVANVAENANTKLALEEIRLKMTLDVNVSLIKKGMAIDTMPISSLVDEIRLESQRNQELFLGEGKEAELSAKASVYRETRQVISDMPYLPAAVIGRLKVEEQYSLSVIHETGTELKAKYESAGQAYETLMTTPRRDMGDSIQKAFQNVDDILADLGMEAVEENRKAVRILGYNSMTINEEAVLKIRDELQTVMQVINDLTPAKTLKLIRQNVNPLDMKIQDLSNKLKTMKTEEKEEKYSSFLYKLEKSNDITEEERTSFIGIYRLMNRLEKTDGASIGAMVNQDREITFRNLLTGMRSKNASMDFSIDDSFGFLDTVIKKGASITDQIDSAYTAKYGNDLEKEYVAENYKEYMNALNSDIKAANDLEQINIPATLNNIISYKSLTDAHNNVFKKLDKYINEYNDNEFANEYISSFDKMTESLEDRDLAKAYYEQLKEATLNYIENLRDYEDNSYIDLKALTLCNKQIALAANLSQNEEYVIPMYSEGNLTTVRLTLKHDKAEKGRVDISYEAAAYGEVSVHLYMEKEAVGGLIVCGSKEGSSHMENVVEGLRNKGYSCNINIVVGKENQRNSYDFSTNTDINSVDTKSLYKLAKDFISSGI